MATVQEWRNAANPAALNELLARYEDGFATPYETLRGLCMELGELESELEPMQQQRERLRTEIGNVLARLGDSAEVRGFGKLIITAPSVSKSFDKDAIKVLIAEWVNDAPAFAERLAACEKVTMRAGGLRIERERGARE